MNAKLSSAVLAAAAAATVVSSAQAATSHSASRSGTKKYVGPVEDMRWGPVQATIYVKNKKITKVKISVNPDTNRSAFIDQNAVPMLQQETLQAQNARIDLVSGATMTSEAYQASLKAAVKAAKKAKSL